MKPTTFPTRALSWNKTLMLLALSSLLAIAFATATHADDDRGQGHTRGGPQHSRGHQQRYDRNWNEHERQSQRYRNRPYFEPGPQVYAPPLIYSPPPYYQEPGINFIIPLHIH